MSFDCTGSGRAWKAMSTTASRACMVRREHFSMTVGLLCGLCRGGAGRAETAGAAHGLRQLGDGQPVDPAEGRDDELRAALAPIDGERLLALVDQADADLATIVGIHRARRVQHGDAVLQREAGARPYLRLDRSEDRRVGNAWGRTCRSRRSR